MPELSGRKAPLSLGSPEWFVFRVRPRHEKAVALQLAQKEQDCFLPLLRQSRCWAKRTTTVDLPLFPGYVFCRAHRFGFRPILETRGVIDVLRVANSAAPVVREEIEAIKQAIDNRATLEACPYYEIGQSVQVARGPLAGLRGPVVEVHNSIRLLLSITLLKRSVFAEVNASDIEESEHRFIYRNFDQYQANVG
jgi:transcription antitermination factor NusG